MKPFVPFIPLSVALLLLVASTATGAPPNLSKEITLRGHGGATFTAPDWKTSRSDDAVAILDRTGADSRGGFTTLVLAVEEGPKQVATIDWELLAGNIRDAAKRAGTPLQLELAGDWSGADGFKGQRFTGTMRRGQRDVDVAMVALIASGVMVTVSALGAPGDATLGPLVAAVAKTTSRPQAAP